MSEGCRQQVKEGAQLMVCAFATPGIDSLESHPSTMVHEPSFRIWNTLGGLPTDARPFKPLLAHFTLGQLPTPLVPPCTEAKISASTPSQGPWFQSPVP